MTAPKTVLSTGRDVKLSDSTEKTGAVTLGLDAMPQAKSFAAFLTIILLAGCSEYLTWNQRLTIVLSTPDGPLEFSAVQSVKLETTSQAYDRVIAGVAGPDSHVYLIQGQAPYIQLSSGHLIAALMMGNGSHNSEPGRLALTYLGDPSIAGPENDDTARAAFENTKVGHTVEIPEKDWPYMVVIPPDREFSRLQPVNGQAGERLTTLIAPGYAVQAVRVEKTDDAVEPITIDAAIPCLSDETPVCQFRTLPEVFRTTWYAMRPGSYLRRTMQQ